MKRILSAVLLYLALMNLAIASSQPVCPPNFAFSAGLCRGAASVCPAGTSLQGGVCTGSPGCPVGSVVEAGMCTQVPTCAGGYTFNGKSGQCTSSPTCAGDGKYNVELGRCVENAQCIPSIAGRRCSCPTGGEYREQGQLCVQGAPVCPTGSRFDAASKACQ